MNYSKIAQDAAKAIQAAGMAMTLTRTSGGTFDAVTGLTSAPTVQTFTVYGVKGGTGLSSRPDEALLAGGLVRAGDSKLLIQGNVVAPQPGDVVTVGGVAFAVVAVFGLDPGGVSLLFNVWVRK